jgi:membrane complex biogenesis BtpA family protein
MFKDIFGASKPLIGMVHLPPLPGSPGWEGVLEDVERKVVSDVDALVAGGVHGLLFENYSDVPFKKDNVGPLTVSAMTRLILGCTKNVEVPFGINVLRNDWESALSIAAITGASFVRVNILYGAYATDSGVIEGAADACLRFRSALEREVGKKILIFSDVFVKHATPLFDRTLEESVCDLLERVGVDGIIITGKSTGDSALLGDIRVAAEAADPVPILVGSGVNQDNIAGYSEYASGFIVGSYLKHDGDIKKGVDSGRVKRLVDLITGKRGKVMG